MPYRTPDDPRKQRRLPMLDRLTIKTPCHASWDAMVGDDRVRHCCQCSRNVYDLRAMFPDEAEAFLDEHLATTGTMPCVRLYRRPDGRVMTSQCPTAVDRKHRARVAGGIAAVATAVAAALYANRPMLAPDGPVVVADRERPVEAVQPQEMVMTSMGMIIERDDAEHDAEGEDGEVYEPLPPTPPATLPVNVTLRANKPPLLWSGSRR